MSKLRVLIVGASIAGPTAAYWFAKAGASVTIIERFPKLRTGGQNIDIRTVGVAVMRKIPGMEAAVRAKTVPMDGISIVGADGRPYGTIHATGDPDQQSLVSEFEILRGDLAQILVDLTKDHKDINYVFGEQIVSMQQHHQRHDGPMTVEFANGFPTSDYDLVVACDGATSRTRAMGLGCGVRDYIVPANFWAAYFSIKQDLIDGSKLGLGYSAVGGRAIAIGPDEIGGGNRVTLMGIYPPNNPDAIQPFRDAMKRGDDELRDFVAKYYEGVGWKSDGAMKGMMEANDFYASEVFQVKAPSLYKGRFVMVGDAGYAAGPTGGGTSLAIGGAYVLAGEIGKHKGDVEAGLKAYEETMRPIITDLQKIPPFIPTVMGPQTATGIWLRNHIFAFVCWSRILQLSRILSRIFPSALSGAFASSERYALPDYEWLD
ncbi:hypothetical protein G7046_g3024 [Stylonectria norvegica]|nr:hypothetical protein G7046_g3024 [Stylonectria norvegica]